MVSERDRTRSNSGDGNLGEAGATPGFFAAFGGSGGGGGGGGAF